MQTTRAGAHKLRAWHPAAKPRAARRALLPAAHRRSRDRGGRRDDPARGARVGRRAAEQRLGRAPGAAVSGRRARGAGAGVERARGAVRGAVPVFSPWLLVAAFREVRRASLVHIHDPLYLTSWVAAFWCLLLRTPYVVHRHVGFVHHSSFVVRLVQRVVLGSVARLVLRGAAVVVPIDEFIASGSPAPLRSRIRVIGNGVDTATLPSRVARGAFAAAAVPRTSRLTSRSPCSSGGSCPRRVSPRSPRRRATAMTSSSSAVTGPLGSPTPRLHFLGGRPAAEMPPIYRCADVMVIASVGECPLTVLEAMSSGLPVLANDDPALHSPWTSGPGVRFVDMASGDLRQALEESGCRPGADAAHGRGGKPVRRVVVLLGDPRRPAGADLRGDP